MKPIKKVLIVCTGNSCRSTMAEGYLNKRINELGLDLIVFSAGTGAIPGMKPTNEAVEVAREHGVDISGYLSSTLNKGLIDKADAILVMEPHHREKVLDLVPEAGGKIHLLRNYSFKGSLIEHSIADPIGKPVDFYRKTFEIIKDSMEGFLKWIQK